MVEDTSKKPGGNITDAESGEPGEPASERHEPVREKEVGGREGPDPTRYGDWEKAGRCIDF